MHKNIIFTAAIFAAVSVALGAFGAHALDGLLTDRWQKSYETAARYLMYHSFALLACGVLEYIQPNRLVVIASKLFIAGIILFCGSLFTLVFLNFKNITNFNFIGAITPLGGICFIVGWMFLAFGARRIHPNT
ncbi:MAG: DUF423 domain-containing protein [Chitinophagaceae bacterium]